MLSCCGPSEFITSDLLKALPNAHISREASRRTAERDRRKRMKEPFWAELVKAELIPDVSSFQMVDFHNDSTALLTVQIRVCVRARAAPVHDEEEERLCIRWPLSKWITYRGIRECVCLCSRLWPLCLSKTILTDFHLLALCAVILCLLSVQRKKKREGGVIGHKRWRYSTV